MKGWCELADSGVAPCGLVSYRRRAFLRLVGWVVVSCALALEGCYPLTLPFCARERGCATSDLPWQFRFTARSWGQEPQAHVPLFLHWSWSLVLEFHHA